MRTNPSRLVLQCVVNMKAAICGKKIFPLTCVAKVTKGFLYTGWINLRIAPCLTVLVTESLVTETAFGTAYYADVLVSKECNVNQ